MTKKQITKFAICEWIFFNLIMFTDKILVSLDFPLLFLHMWQDFRNFHLHYPV